jgi:hypothetical protein
MSFWQRLGSPWRRLGTTSTKAARASTRSAFALSKSLELKPIWCLFEGQVNDDLLWAGPTHTCLCGNNVFLLLAWFEEHKVAGYFTEAVCSSCWSVVRAPTEADE